jgi:hypothetical protein
MHASFTFIRRIASPTVFDVTGYAIGLILRIRNPCHAS